MKKLIIAIAIISLFAIAISSFNFSVTDNIIGMESESTEFDTTVIIPPDHEHDYAFELTKKSTCLGKGIVTYTCDCGDSFTEELEPNGHTSVKAGSKSATCTDRGYVNYVCSVCDVGLSVSYTPALGHSFTDAGSGCGPGCYYSCVRCGLVSTNRVPCTDKDTNGVCDLCGNNI